MADLTFFDCLSSRLPRTNECRLVRAFHPSDFAFAYAVSAIRLEVSA